MNQQERERAEEGVGERMQGDVGVAVAQQALRVRYVDAADYAASSVDEAVYVETGSYAYVCHVNICFRHTPSE